jgi:hypothetical protein
VTESTEQDDERVDPGERRLERALVIRIARGGEHALGPQESDSVAGRRADLATVLDETTGEGAGQWTVRSMHEDRHDGSVLEGRGPEDTAGSSLIVLPRTRGRRGGVRPRHSDADLLGLARDGSAPAFAALLHRHRDVIQRSALRAEHPERVVESTMVAAVRDLRRDRVDISDPRRWLGGLVEELAMNDPGRPGVERLLPTDWFDRSWVRVEMRWPSGRPRLVAPRWARNVVAALALALLGAGTTYAMITADAAQEVLSELIAEPIDDPDALAVPGPVVEATPEEAPELFDDIELGELPAYDLTGDAGRGGAQPPTGAPPETTAPEEAAEDAVGSDDAPAENG